MAIAPYRASTDLLRPFFEDFLMPNGEGGRLGGGLLRAPVSDVVESESEIKVIAEMPGLSPADIQIDIENNVLTIAGEKHEDRKEGEKNTWHLTERRYGHFSRSFVLPRDVDQEGIQANFENGILTVTVPKSARARRRRIEVQADAGRQNVETSAS